MRGQPGRILLSGAMLALFCIISPAARAQGLGNPTVRDSNVGYVDPAIPGNRAWLRFDYANDNPRPSRAEFFYPQGAPLGPGPALPDTSATYQDVLLGFEALLAPGLSAFVEGVGRSVQLQQNPDATGIGDMNAGFRFSFLESEDFVATFQFRTYIPTGDAFRGLGTRHVSLEPALLIFGRLGENWCFEGELRDWIPIGGTDFAGNVLRAGAGVSYAMYQNDRVRIDPVGEVVGWVVLGGKESFQVPTGEFLVKDAAGDTIVNAKLGVRVKVSGWGDLYAGYGRALTGDRWYANTVRIEWRVWF